MPNAEPLVEVWRGPFCESLHRGHAVIWDAGGDVVAAWGDPDAVILPRSSCKMIQALPLIESGAAEAFGLSDAQLALACASHQGAHVHTEMVEAWLDDLGLPEDAFRCGPQMPNDRDARYGLIRAFEEPGQKHNNCSGKHSGFLTLSKHLGAGPEYVDLDHPVQIAVKAAFEETTGETSPGYGIDGCSAPNFACTVTGLARAMAGFAAATGDGDTRDQAQHRLTRAMAAYPHLVAGEGRACTNLMRAMEGRASVKTGAEAVFIAILPEQKLGIAVKIEDGTTRGAEAVITQLLVGAGVLEADHPVAHQYRYGPIRNRREIETGQYRLAAGLADWTL
ncbi:asparaginase [Roseobacter sp. HKCCD9010]|uniref:asparaginase n=1 Tax=unclassified Roseobacter TaxID=196798 RepID=UPI001490A6DC|nr:MULTISPECIES: asparaginase [unclassified Roseobacter]MBF9051199.1 asparaginase [Rhodobacterales bacterium HKCCD4356]NNV12968.1 asparaginase [Roseobacter sp. HKCCD7357]NNV16913.1 asparaginase [Roseobacter sp. HKCCD8768]NNV26455.1 asparaginase [Roseobacter sp. HKCCD8192]NNV30634.1 asparaginase [Roseobacter sp. HKCCD9061]